MKQWMWASLVLLAACRPPLAQQATQERDGGRARSEAAPVAQAAERAVPDGQLWAYDRSVAPRRVGAMQWQAVTLSRRHALAAAQDHGRLAVPTPDGRSLAFRFEHQRRDGDHWSWIGRAEGGPADARALLVFGPYGAIGSIADADGAAWQLATFEGRTWVGRALAAGPAAALADAASFETDYLMPPADRPVDTAAGGPADQQAIVDLVVGYTVGYANGFQDRARAESNLYNIQATINDALYVSQINARVRIVHAMQVDYPDDNSNFQALREMTGADGTAAAPAFSALRQARDSYGGDLVLLVRNQGYRPDRACGASWLIGGNLKGIDASDAGLGYLVWNHAYSYSLPHCHPFAAPHVIGHSFGLQHDRASASPRGALEYGATPYAFGYVHGNPGYGQTRTTMAYPFESGSSYSYIYSTPDITCSPTAPCVLGVANEADNVRTARQTIPAVASFRPRKVLGDVVRGDFDAGGTGDLYWRNPSTQQFAYWTDLYGTRSAGFYMQAEYEVAGIGDFTGDGRSDVLWKSDAYKYLVLWVAKDNGYEQRGVGGYEPGMSFVGIGDFDGDERQDLMWRSHDAELLKVWRMNGAQIRSQFIAAMPQWYQLLGIGDYNGDGYSDVIYADSSDVNLYLNNGFGFVGQRIGARPQGWTFLGSGDLNNDRREDLIWQNAARTTASYWTMDGARILANPSLATYPNRRFVGARHVDRNPSAELLWLEPAYSAGSSPNLMVTVVDDPYSPGSTQGLQFPAGWEPR
ncbi:reprolysin-like metallopeptidase [Lysobacter firmicutimachus]|uniref:Reprolysin-like metallopeptidase n=1 Tax=Lysobacter firmicutimachus TaxID=1792846 RepID=A0AAU8N1G8_9GAMM